MVGSRVYTLLVQVGRAAGDGLPEDATGAALLCYAPGLTEKNAVDETVAVLRQADLAPLEVEALGSVADREAAGEVLADDDLVLIRRALQENAVIVSQVEVFKN
jgi:hypothetical protein